MDLSSVMKAEAVKHGLCQKWTSEWEDNSSKEQMIDKYLRGFNFCIKTGFPTPQQMKDYFDGVMQKYGIYCDEKVVDDNVKGNIYLNGDCNAILEVKEGFVEIYVRHSSMAKIIVRERASVFVNILDGADVVIEADKGSRVSLYDYGPDTSHLINGTVKIKDRNGYWEKVRMNKYAENIQQNA